MGSTATSNSVLHLLKDPPAKLVNELQGLAAWVAMNEVNTMSDLNQKQKEQKLFELYHGSLEIGQEADTFEGREVVPYACACKNPCRSLLLVSFISIRRSGR